MKVIINGAGGRMGRALRAITENPICVDAYVQEEGFYAALSDVKEQADCIIDFSNHAGIFDLTAYAAEKNLPVVVCTTGHTEEEMAAIRACAENVPVFHSGNMSLGIAVLTRLVKTAVKMFPDADVEIVESHHNQKLDVPSGTALMLAKAVQAARPEATLLVGRHENGKRTKAEVGIHSLRMGNTVGIHEVIINTGTQLLTLKHEAQDRALFADGAVAAAAFLVAQKPGLYTMDDLVKE